MKEVATFHLSDVQITFCNYEDVRGSISNCILTIDGEDFQISSDTATYHRLLNRFKAIYPSAMRAVYDAAPRLR